MVLDKGLEVYGCQEVPYAAGHESIKLIQAVLPKVIELDLRGPNLAFRLM